MKKSKLYVCHTLYQVLITIIKKFNDESKIDLVICNTIPNCDHLVDKISQKKWFETIYVYDEKENSKIFGNEKIERKMFRSNQMITLFESTCNINVLQYEDIYLYNDWTTFGAYLIDKKVRYHLIEDCIDGFYYMKENFKNRITFLNPTFTYHIKHFIKKLLHIGYDFFGQSKYVIDLEVNDINKVPFTSNKFVEVSKDALYSSLSDAQKNEIYYIFTDEKIKYTNNKKSLLLLTQPLFKDAMVKSLDIQKKVYLSIIEKYKDDYDITIKPHPRDDFDYKKLGVKLNFIDKFMPIEILNFNKSVHFDLAVTIMSSSIRSLEIVDEKIELGLDYLQKIENK